METLGDLAQRKTARGTLPAQARAATIRTTALAATDELFVTFDLSSTTILHGPCVGWESRDGTFPTGGDRAAVMELDDRSLWIVAWWPST